MVEPAPDRVALVTGASAGIGLETALGLARAGFRVVMAGRDATRTERAREDVAKRLAAERRDTALVETALADFASQHPVWFLRSVPPARESLAEFPGVLAWADRVAGIGHGERSECAHDLTPGVHVRRSRAVRQPSSDAATCRGVVGHDASVETPGVTSITA